MDHTEEQLPHALDYESIVEGERKHIHRRRATTFDGFRFLDEKVFFIL